MPPVTMGHRASCRVVASRRIALPKKSRVLTTFSGFRTQNVVDCANTGTRAAATLQEAARRAGVSGGVSKNTTSMMFERFTEKAIKVVMLAQEEARRLGHNFVGTEQILLGLIGESTGIAAKVLKSMGVTLKDARTEVEKVIGRGSGFVAVEIPFTPRAKRVLELSLEEARQLGMFTCVCFLVGPLSFISSRDNGHSLQATATSGPSTFSSASFARAKEWQLVFWRH